MEREVGGRIGMGNTCKPMAVSFQCMTKFTTNKKIYKFKKKRKKWFSRAFAVWACLRKQQKILFTSLIALVHLPVVPVIQAPFSIALSFKSAADMTSADGIFSHAAHMCLFRLHYMWLSRGELNPSFPFTFLIDSGKNTLTI